jgi:isocitrate dehydrogenase kinase/phosphatase
MSLLEFEKKYWESLDNQQKQLLSLYEEIKSNASISLKKKDITKAILLRMKAYYDVQDKIKKFLNKRYLPAASDFFVETIVFYLKVILDIEDIGLEVHSERQIRQKKGTIRPDISVWKNDKVVAIIECKTQLGWNRDKWEEDFKKRESKLKDEFPNAKAFLVVMTSKNWPGFPTDNKKVGEQYFTLSSVWPKNILLDKIDDVIMNMNPIEDLFKKIISCGETAYKME